MRIAGTAARNILLLHGEDRGDSLLSISYSTTAASRQSNVLESTSPPIFDPEIPGTDLAELWRTVAQFLPDNIVAVDRRGIIRWFNRTLPEHRRAQVIGSHCTSFVTEESKARYGHVLEVVFRGEAPDVYEVQTLDGRWWLTRAVPVRDRLGDVIAALFIASEITQRKEMEASLRERQRLLERIQDASPAATFLLNLADFRLIYANARTAQMIGFEADELVAKQDHFVEFLVHPEDLAPARSALQELQSSVDDRLMTLDVRCRHRDGDWRWLHVRMTVFDRDAAGDPATGLGTALDISDVKLAERRIAEQSKMLARIDELSPAGVFLYDLNRQKLLHGSSQFTAMLGYSLEELVAMGSELVSLAATPESLRLVQDDLMRVATLAPGETFERDYCVRHASGELRWVSARSRAFQRSATGEVEVVIGVALDVTERKTAEAALAEQRHFLTHLTQAAPALIFVWDVTEDRPVYVSEHADTLLGYSATELLISGEALRAKIGHPDDLERVAGVVRELVDAPDGEMRDIEYRQRHRDGTWKWVQTRSTVFKRRPDGTVHLVIGLLFDISARRQAEKSLAESEARLRSVMEYAPDLIAQLDQRGRITFANHPIEGVAGCLIEETSALAWVIADDAHRLREALDTVFTEGKTVHTELRVHRLDGAERTYDCRFGPIVVNRQIESAIVIARDVTAERQAAETLRLQEAQLAHASRLTTSGGMLAGISHEVNQPLYAISNFATAGMQLLSGEDSPKADTVRQWLARIAEQADRAGDIIRRLREFVRKGQSAREPQDLNGIMRDSLRFVESQTKAARVRVHAATSAGALYADVDRVQIQQVLVNLLQNACDAMARCQVAERYLLAAAVQDQSAAHLSIMDRGEGVPIDDLERVFDPFFTTKPEGLGLGLAISRNIVTAHGGQLWASRNVGAGSTFHVTLPLTGVPAHER